MSIGMSEGSAEDVPVKGSADVGGDRVAEILGVEGDWVAFVDGLAVDHRLNRRQVIVSPGVLVAVVEFGSVAILPHVE